MRVGIFTDNDFEKVNGVTTTLNAVLRHAPADMGVRVYTADSRGANTPQYLSLRSPGLPLPFYREMRLYFPRIAEYIRRAKDDRLDVVHMTTPGPIGLAAMRVARVLNLPMVGTFHTDLAAYASILSGRPWLGTLMREYMRWPYGRCERVLVPSTATKALLVGATGDPDRIGIWTRGVDTDFFSPHKRSEALRRSWKVSDTRPAILYVGRLSREKGLSMFPALQQMLRGLGIPHRFVLAGQGPMRPELEARLDNAVFTGVLGREDVATAFASADVFLFPSRTDTAGNVVLEAQACGLPVMVSDAGGPQENMLGGVTGIVVGGTQIDAWSLALTKLLRDKARRGRMAVAARQYSLTRRWDTALAPLFDTYHELALARASTMTHLVPMARGSVS